MTSRKGKVLNAIIPTKTHRAIEAFLKANGMSQANLVRLAVAEFLSQKGVKMTVEDLTPGDWGGHRKSDSEGDESPELLAASGFGVH